jgi:MinD-like ATPase involved in chromosome partitioning or flagellar assembly
VLQVGPKRILHSVSEFVKGQCELHEVPIDLSREVGLENGGSLFFLPASTDTQAVTSILLEGYDVGRLNEHLLQVARDLDVDYLLLDTHMGINRETLLSLAICDTVLIVLRPDGLDHQGASVLAHLAKKLDVPACLLVPNMVADGSDLEQLSARIEQEIGAPTAGVLSWCQELWHLECPSLFAASRPDHPFTADLGRVSERLLSVAETHGSGGRA